MSDRQEHDNERRLDRDRGYDNERWAPQGREFGHERQDRGFSGQANYGGHSGSQGGYSGSQAGYTEPRGGSGRENYGRENFGNESPRGVYSSREDWQGSEPSRGNQGWFEGNESRGRAGNTATYAGEREQTHQYSGGNWAGGMGTYSGGTSGERGNQSGRIGGFGQSNYGQGTQNVQTAQTGRFYGRGPKSYQRSDDRIKEDINERLTQHADIDATEIDVEVKQAEVTLRGTVDNRQEKRMAEDIAENVFGVKDVKNEIRLHSHQQTPAASTSGSSTSIGAQTKTANK